MWGVTGRGDRLTSARRPTWTLGSGLARVAVRGPVEHGVLELSGELDFSVAESLRDIVAELDHRIVSIDVTGLEFVDCAGVRALEQVREDRADLHGERPAVVGASQHIARAIRYVRVREPQLASR